WQPRLVLLPARRHRRGEPGRTGGARPAVEDRRRRGVPDPVRHPFAGDGAGARRTRPGLERGAGALAGAGLHRHAVRGPAMKLLAFETSTEACSVALWRDGDVVERFEIAPRR